jgi:hypothetical protein
MTEVSQITNINPVIRRQKLIITQLKDRLEMEALRLALLERVRRRTIILKSIGWRRQNRG